MVQGEVRRFDAQLFLSHASLVLVGLELDTVMSLTASLCLWFSVILSLAGFGLTLRALEVRFGRLSLRSFHGLYEHSPTLAVCFLLTGLASVGFPGTLGFISTELLLDAPVEVDPTIGIAGVAAARPTASQAKPISTCSRGRHASTGLAGDWREGARRGADPGGDHPGRRTVPPARASTRRESRPRKPARVSGRGPCWLVARLPEATRCGRTAIGPALPAVPAGPRAGRPFHAR